MISISLCRSTTSGLCVSECAARGYDYAGAQWGPVGDATTAVWNGAQTPAEAMADAQAAAEKAIADMAAVFKGEIIFGEEFMTLDLDMKPASKK